MNDPIARKLGLAAACAGLLAFGAAAPALAESPQQAVQAPAAGAAGQPSEAELHTFVVAALGVQRVNKDWQPKVSAANSQQEAEELSRQARTEMIAAVEQSGLSLDQYNTIATTVRSDPQLQERVRSIAASQNR